MAALKKADENSFFEDDLISSWPLSVKDKFGISTFWNEILWCQGGKIYKELTMPS